MREERRRQAEMVADILNSTRTGERTLVDIQELTGAYRETAKAWLSAFEQVGILTRGTVYKVSPKNGRSYASHAWTSK